MKKLLACFTILCFSSSHVAYAGQETIILWGYDAVNCQLEADYRNAIAYSVIGLKCTLVLETNDDDPPDDNPPDDNPPDDNPPDVDPPDDNPPVDDKDDDNPPADDGDKKNDDGGDTKNDDDKTDDADDDKNDEADNEDDNIVEDEPSNDDVAIAALAIVALGFYLVFRSANLATASRATNNMSPDDKEVEKRINPYFNVELYLNDETEIYNPIITTGIEFKF